MSKSTPFGEGMVSAIEQAAGLLNAVEQTAADGKERDTATTGLLCLLDEIGENILDHAEQTSCPICLAGLTCVQSFYTLISALTNTACGEALQCAIHLYLSALVPFAQAHVQVAALADSQAIVRSLRQSSKDGPC
jgi:hypothetical protein